MVELSSEDSQPDPDDFLCVLSVDGSFNQQGSGVGAILKGLSGDVIPLAI